VAIALASVGRPKDAAQTVTRADCERQVALLEVAKTLIQTDHRSDAVDLMLAAADEPTWAPDILAAMGAMYPRHAEELANLLLTQAE
jgi:hypothetical protein